MNIPLILGIGLSAQPVSGCDIGGFCAAWQVQFYKRLANRFNFLAFSMHMYSEGRIRKTWVAGYPYLTISFLLPFPLNSFPAICSFIRSFPYNAWLNAIGHDEDQVSLM